MREDNFLKGGEERRTAEFEREAQVSVVQPGMKVQSETSAPVRGLFRWMCLSGARGAQTLAERQLRSLPPVSFVGRGTAETWRDDRDVPRLSLMSSSFVCETDAISIEGSPRSPAAPVYNYTLESEDTSSVGAPTGDMKVLILRLKSDTEYNATVYSQAPDGTEGQPLEIGFRTGMLGFVQWVQPESRAQSFALCDSGSELALSSHAARSVVGGRFLEEILVISDLVRFFLTQRPRLFFR